MKKVMVIDDEPFILMMIEDKLERANLKVVTLNKSVTAVERIRQERPDLIILDWMMPEISGLEVARALYEDPELKGIPVFMLSAKGQEEDQRRGLDTGVLKYIIKPFSPQHLLDEVLMVLGDGD